MLEHSYRDPSGTDIHLIHGELVSRFCSKQTVESVEYVDGYQSSTNEVRVFFIIAIPNGRAFRDLTSTESVVNLYLAEEDEEEHGFRTWRR